MRKALREMFRVLTFRITREEIDAFGRPELVAGLIATWIVGMGRYWDSPLAHPLQLLGVGSVVYVFVLAALLWLIVLPYQLAGWTYRRVLTYVTLTAAPAVLYAIPVETFLSMEDARTTNAWFLVVVALWRVGLLVHLLRRFGLRALEVFVTTLLPLMVIVFTLSVLNLEHAVFQIMAGIRTKHTSNDGAYALISFFALLSVLGILPTLIAYGALIYRRARARKVVQSA